MVGKKNIPTKEGTLTFLSIPPLPHFSHYWYLQHLSRSSFFPRREFPQSFFYTVRILELRLHLAETVGRCFMCGVNCIVWFGRCWPKQTLSSISGSRQEEAEVSLANNPTGE